MATTDDGICGHELLPAESNNYAWADALVNPPRETAEALRSMHRVFGSLAESPVFISMDAHLEAVSTLARLLKTIAEQKQGCSVRHEPVFEHMGQQCNHPYFELYHRVAYAAERWLWLAQRDDVGPPDMNTTLTTERRACLAQQCRVLIALLNYTQRCVNHRWTQKPSGLLIHPPYMHQLQTLVRAYGLWNAAVAYLDDRTPELDATSAGGIELSHLADVLKSLSEAVWCFRPLPARVDLAQRAFSLCNPVVVPAHKDDGLVEECERAAPDPHNAPRMGRTWPESMYVMFLRCTAAFWSYDSVHRTLRVGRELVVTWHEPMGVMQQWEAQQRVLNRAAVPGWNVIHDAMHKELPRHPQALVTGDNSALDTALALTE